MVDSALLNSLFTVSITPGRDICVQGVSGLGRNTRTVEVIESTDIPRTELAEHLEIPNFTIEYELPIMGGSSPAGPASYRIVEPQPNWHFEASIRGSEGFLNMQKISDISIRTEEEEVIESSQIHVKKLAGHQRFSDVSLTQVISTGSKEENSFIGSLYNWMAELGEFKGPGSVSVEGHKPIQSRKDLMVKLLMRDGTPAAKWTLRDSFPKTFSVGDMDALGRHVLTRGLTLSIGGIEVEGDMPQNEFTAWVNTAFNIPEIKPVLIIKAYKREDLQGADLSPDFGFNVMKSPPAKTWKIFNAWPKRVTLGEIDATSDSTFKMTVEVVSEGFMEV